MADIQLLFQIIKTLVGAFGILGNGLVILVITRFRFMHTLTNALICHQAVVDWLAALVLLIRTYIVLQAPLAMGDTSSNLLLCRVWVNPFVQLVLFIVSTYSLLFLTLVRYVAIVYPTSFNKALSRSKVVGAVLMVSAWGIGVAIKSYNLSIYTIEDGVCLLKRTDTSHVAGAFVVIFQFFLPTAIMLFCYVHMIVTVKRNARTASEPALELKDTTESQTVAQIVQRSPSEKSTRKAQQITTNTLIVVFVTFLLCWAPSQIWFFMFNVGWIVEFPNDVHRLRRNLSIISMALNCCVNPIIYALKYRAFRRCLRSLLRCAEAQEEVELTNLTETKSVANDD